MKNKLIIAGSLLICVLFLFACGKQENDSEESSSDIPDDSAFIGPVPPYPLTDKEEAQAIEYEFSLPEDFEEIDLDGFECYYSARDGSSVNLNIQPKDPDFGTISSGQLNETLSSVLSLTYGDQVTVTDLYFTTEAVSNYPAYQYSFSYELRGHTYRQLVVGVDADQSYTFTYTDVSGEWTEIFEQSAGTIRFSNPNHD